MINTIEIQNLKCDGCVKTVTEKIEELEGVSNVVVSLENNNVTFEILDEKDMSMVLDKLKEIGYPKKDERSLLDKAKSYLNN